MISPSQLRKYVVFPTLNYLTPEIPYSIEAEDLLMGTAIQESDCGRFLHQIQGPALGIFQMEPATARDHMIWLASHPAANDKILRLVYDASGPVEQLPTNLALACAMARLHYWRAPGPIPKTLQGQAAYWKRYYNTPLGAGTEEQYVSNWIRFLRVA